MTFYTFDHNGYYTGTVDGVNELDEPFRTSIAPPDDIPEGHRAQWNGVDAWGIEVIPAVFDPFANPPQSQLSRLDFFERFEDPEIAEIYTQAKTNVQFEIMLDKFKAAEYIDLTDARLISALRSLEVAQIIGAGRADAILKIQ